MKLLDALIVGALAALSLAAFAQQMANAEKVDRPPEELTMVLPPPQRFDRPYAGKMTEYRMFVDAARFMCRKQGVDADSCSWVNGGRCFIVIPFDGPVKDREQYRRHEIAHCNGWGAGHER